MKSRLHQLFLLIVTIFAVASAAWAQQSAPHYDSAETVGAVGPIVPMSTLGRSSIGLQVETAQKKMLPLELTTPGKIEAIPSREYAQHSPVSGRVSEVMVNLGDQVQRGQILLQLQSQDLNRLAAQILQTRQDIEAQIQQQTTILDDEVNECQARIKFANETHERNNKLLSERIGPEKAVQESLANLDVARAQMKAALEKREIVLKSLKAKLSLVMQPLRQQLEMLGSSEADIDRMLKSNDPVTLAPVRSARTGVITVINASPGQSVDPSVKLFTVSDLSKVWATAQIYEDDMARIKLGQKVKVHVSSFQNTWFEGVINYIGDRVDPRSRTLPVRAEIPNSPVKLKPDMYAELLIQINDPAMSLLLPSEAVVQRNGHSLVFVEERNGFQPTRVTLGRSLGDAVEITSGLSPGQRVAVRGAFQLAAEMLKTGGNVELFQQATQGDHEQNEMAKETASASSISPQVAVVGIAIAFILGCAISTISGAMRKNRQTRTVITEDETTPGPEPEPASDSDKAQSTRREKS